MKNVLSWYTDLIQNPSVFSVFISRIWWFHLKIARRLAGLQLTPLYFWLRTTALELFSKYAWDDSDSAEKEVTRYQGGPGQATSYTLGQQKIIEMRRFCEKKLGDKFELRDFHYQVLSTGSALEKYLEKHIKRYVECIQGDLDEDSCDYILYPKKLTKETDLYEFEKYELLKRRFPYNFV